jgi:hypothetical protein
VLLNLLVSSGIIKLPPGVTIPPLPTSPASALHPSIAAQLKSVEVELDPQALAEHIRETSKLLADALSA